MFYFEKWPRDAALTIESGQNLDLEVKTSSLPNCSHIGLLGLPNPTLTTLSSRNGTNEGAHAYVSGKDMTTSANNDLPEHSRGQHAGTNIRDHEASRQHSAQYA